ncbi:MAG: hypothetical protein WKG00_29125, partial [Polyangiaceae bacterium]
GSADASPPWRSNGGRARWIEPALLAVLLAFAFALGFVEEFSGDFHWHVMLGDWMREHGAIYRHDTLSHTFHGAPMVVTAWLGDVLLSAAFRSGGYVLCFVVRGAALAGMAALLFRECRALGASPLASFALPMAVLVDGGYRFFLRPETLSFVLLVAVLHLLGAMERAGGVRAAGKGRVAALLAVLVVWTNLHGSMPLGLLAVAAWTGEMAARCLHRRAWRDLAWTAALPLGAALAASLSAEGPAAILVHRSLTAGCNVQTEWLPMTVSSLTLIEVFGSMALVVTTALAAKRVSFWRLVLGLVLVVLTVQHRRFLTALTLVSIPWLASNLAAMRASRVVLRLRHDLRALVAVILGVGTAGLVGWQGLVEDDLLGSLGTGAQPGVYPEAACAFVREHPVPGRMYNDFDFGSYLTFCLHDVAPVAIDQRVCTLYPGEFYQHYMSAPRAPENLRRVADSVDASWAFVTRGSATQAMAADPWRWRLLYADDVASIYVRADRPETARLAETSPVQLIDASRLIDVVLYPPSLVPALDRALAEQVRRCPGCSVTRWVTAAVAAARGDAEALAADIERIDAGERDSTPRLVSLLRGRQAVLAGDMPAAHRHLEQFVAAGGPPQLAERALQPRLRESARRQRPR